MKSVCVYMGSSPGRQADYLSAAQALGRALAEEDLALVYGGGSVGLMGATADACLDAGGRVIGVITQSLQRLEVGHDNLTELHVVERMHERKALMAQRADAFVALPRGLGTLDEFFEILTWSQLGLHNKPCALFNVAGYFDGLLSFIEHSVAECFVHSAHRETIVVANDCAQLLRELRGRMRLPSSGDYSSDNSSDKKLTDKWLDR